jgi:hypothetical protein
VQIVNQTETCLRSQKKHQQTNSSIRKQPSKHKKQIFTAPQQIYANPQQIFKPASAMTTNANTAQHSTAQQTNFPSAATKSEY